MPVSPLEQLRAWTASHPQQDGAFVLSDGAAIVHVAFAPRQGPTLDLASVGREARAAGRDLAGQLPAPLQWAGVCFEYWEGPKSGVLPLTLLATKTRAGTFRWMLLGDAPVIAHLTPPIEEVREFYVNPLRLGALRGT